MQLSDIDALDGGLTLKQGFPATAAFKKSFEEVCKRRFLYGPAFEPYGAAAGLIDLGPVGCALKTQLLSHWRQWYVVYDDLCELETTNLHPAEVFRTSGHTERFVDWVVLDTVTGTPERADKVIENHCRKTLQTNKALSAEEKSTLEMYLNNAGAFQGRQFDDAIAALGLKSAAGNPFGNAYEQNMMFPTCFGTAESPAAYLRPELAQSIILNFKRVLEVNNGKMPVGAACIGTAFRNEIAPRGGLLRAREFPLAEIEYFVHPTHKEKWAKFDDVKGVALPLLSQAAQLGSGQAEVMTLERAVKEKIIGNEALAYYIGRTALFLESLGVRYFRFRQHRANEMAHYASDCWDAEVMSSSGWLECVGLADRSAFDLTAHNKKTGGGLVARFEYDKPREEVMLVRQVAKGPISGKFKAKSPAIMQHLHAITDDEAEALSYALHGKGKGTHAREPTDAIKAAAAALPRGDGGCVVVEAGGEKFEMLPPMFSADVNVVKVTGEPYVPHVIEPSFGIGRLLHVMLEQAFWSREVAASILAAAEARKKGEKPPAAATSERTVLSLPPQFAPFRVSILPEKRTPASEKLADELRAAFNMRGLNCRIDNSAASLGKRYTRSDEVGVPIALTIDDQSVSPPDGKAPSVTLRDRDTCEQVRVAIDEVVGVVDSITRAPPVNSEVAISRSAVTAKAVASGVAKGGNSVDAATWGGATWADICSRYERQNQKASAAVGAAAAAKAAEEAAAATRAWPLPQAEALQAEIQKQGDKVRALKGQKVEKAVLQPDIDRLKALKTLLETGPAADAPQDMAEALAVSVKKILA